MTRKVYTYQSIRELSNHPHYGKICNWPHITATVNMKQAVDDFCDDIKSVYDVHTLRNGIIGSWFETEVITGQYFNMTSILREMKNLSERENCTYNAFLKNKREVLNAIRMLVEADVYPDDLCPQSQEEKLFKALWSKLEEVDATFGTFRAEMDAIFCDEETFLACLDRFSEIKKADTIVLHGFYYITAIQERIFDILEKHGKQLVFLCCINQEEKEVNEIWYATLSEMNRFEPCSVWTAGVSKEPPTNDFGKVFSGGKEFKTLENIRIVKYENEAAFVSDLKRIDQEGYSIYTTDMAFAEKAMREVFPEKFKRKHLLSYPVGQYLYALHSMWDAEQQRLNLSFENIQKCFASGWVCCDGINAINYTYSLEMVAPFFSDCDDIQQWKMRTAFLRNQSSQLSELFEGHIAEQPYDEKRWHRIMSNPFLNFSCYSMDSETADTILQLIEQLIETAQYLFSDGDQIDITEHFKRLEKILRNRDESLIYEEERAIMAELLERIKAPHFPVKKCLPEDISDAVMMIIGGGILDQDNYEILAEKDDVFMRSLFQIETAPLTAEGKLHLCLADENRLPGKAKSYVWPLSFTLLDAMANRISGRRKQYLKDLIHVNESHLLANRYLFHSALQNNDVEISWITEEKGNEIAESPYIRILNTVFGCNIESYAKYKSENIDIKSLKPFHMEPLKIPEIELQVEEVQNTVALCPWRYLYGYITADHPSYHSDFHYKFAMAALIGMIQKITGRSYDEVSKNVLECFPYLTPVEKRQTKDYASASFILDGTDSLGNVSYVKERLKVHFLKDDVVRKVLDWMETHEETIDTVNLAEHKLVDFHTCLYCAFKDECIHAVREKEES